MSETCADLMLAAREKTLLETAQRQIYQRTDHMFAILMPIQWLAAVAAAYWLSPQTWSGTTSSTHPHVWLALFFGGLLCCLPVVLVWLLPGRALSRYTIAMSQVLFSSLLIHITGGRIETHFHVFGSLAFLAGYRDWKLLLPPTLLVAADHFLRGAFFPESVFGTVSAGSWRWLEHGGWVIFEVLFLTISIRQSAAEMRVVARQTAELELNHAQLTEAKRVADAANAAKSEFLANMSHEIRTPLGGILGFTDVLLRGIGSPEKREDYLRTIQSSGKHLLTLLNDILDLSKIEAGHMEFERVRCSPHAILSEVLSVLRVRAQEKGLRLDCEWASMVPDTIETDPARFRQLIMNLTANAIKFTEKGSVIIRPAIHPDGPEPRFVCEIDDTGIGIRPEHLEKIFLPFDQADNSITRKFGGTGLGLAISRHIVKALGGKITVTSLFGRGSTFRATIDSGSMEGVAFHAANMSEVLSVPLAARTAQPMKPLPPIRVLLVEDGETNRELLSLVLTESGATVACANNGEAGVRLALTTQFDVVLMDMQMPVMDGYTATRLLRSQGFKTPILALTAHSMRGDEEKCLEAGCSGYLSKPIQIDQMISTIRRALYPEAPAESEGDTAKSIDSQLSKIETLLAEIESDDAVAHPDVSPIVSSLLADRPGFAPIIDDFIETLAGKQTEMKTAFAERDWQELAGLAHWLRGSGGTVGFDCLTTPTAELEQAALGQDLGTTQRYLDDIMQLIARIRAVPSNG